MEAFHFLDFWKTQTLLCKLRNTFSSFIAQIVAGIKFKISTHLFKKQWKFELSAFDMSSLDHYSSLNDHEIICKFFDKACKPLIWKQGCKCVYIAFGVCCAVKKANNTVFFSVLTVVWCPQSCGKASYWGTKGMEEKGMQPLSITTYPVIGTKLSKNQFAKILSGCKRSLTVLRDTAQSTWTIGRSSLSQFHLLRFESEEMEMIYMNLVSGGEQWHLVCE